jgi:beta-mannosidase
MKHLPIACLMITTMMQFSCSSSKEMKKMELSSDWKFRKAGEASWLPATVPGCVHTDLLDKKLIPDPFYRKNELEVKWIETTDWEYITSFEAPSGFTDFSNIDIDFGGLDTYADVYLNDSLVLKADNMFIGWTIPVKDILKNGTNTLRIYFHSAVNVGMEKLRKVPYTLMAINEIAPENERTNVFTRKAPFHYGWDWGPRLVTCGVWKPVNLILWDKVKIEDLYIKPIKIEAAKASYRAVVEMNANQNSTVNLEVRVDSGLVASKKVTAQKGISQFEIDFDIENPELWWTNGLGGQKLYKVEVRMANNNIPIQSVSKRIGVRKLELSQQKDSIGTSFEFKLNGVPVFMKGANYIPSDIFLTRNTLSNYKRVVSDAINANMNMLRVWGGAIYENDEFYDLLDENGVLAWNDFMFACNLQPDDSLHLDNIRKEAEYNVKRLRNHPSVALWCGNNENLRGWLDWKWYKKYSEKDSAVLWRVYQDIFYRILPEAVNKFNPEVSYWPSSPQSPGNKLSDRVSGNEHDWAVWFGDVPFSAYSEKVPRFVSEYGLQGFPEIKTIKAFADETDMSYRSPVMEHRQRSNMPWIAAGFNGNEMIKRYMSRYYKVPFDFESFVYVSQVVQAEGVRYAIETHRRSRPGCMGSLYWQINDCWPTMSWASVDYFGRWKALHYFVKNAFQPVYPVIFRDGKNINISVASDKLSSANIRIEATLYDFAGKVLWQKNTDTLLAANASSVYMSIPENKLLTKVSASQSVFEAVVKSGDQVLAENLFYFKDCKDLKLGKPIIKKTITKTGNNEYEIALTADKLVKNLAFYTKVSEGFFSNNYFDVIPGKVYKITFIGNSENLGAELELKCINEAK